MYKKVPPPVRYDLADYMKGVSNGSPVNGTEEKSTYELRPMSQEDMSSHAREDVEEWMKKYGQNTTRLGSQMTDAEFKKHYGHTW